MVETVEKSIVVLGYIMMSFSIYISSYFKKMMDFKISKNNIRRVSRENRISLIYTTIESHDLHSPGRMVDAVDIVGRVCTLASACI